MAVPPLHALVAAGHEIVARRHPPGPPPRSGDGDEPEPGEGGGDGARPPRHPRHRRRRWRRMPSSASSSPTDGSSSRTCSPPCRWSTCTSPCCRDGAARRRSSGRSWPATTSTGVCIMDVEETLDTGGVYACREVPIGPATTAAELRSTLVQLGTALLVDVLSTPLPDTTAAGRRGDVCGEDLARRAAAALVTTGGRARPHRACRRRVDDVPRPPAEGPPGERRGRRCGRALAISTPTVASSRVRARCGC